MIKIKSSNCFDAYQSMMYISQHLADVKLRCYVNSSNDTVESFFRKNKKTRQSIQKIEEQEFLKIQKPFQFLIFIYVFNLIMKFKFSVIFDLILIRM